MIPRTPGAAIRGGRPRRGDDRDRARGRSAGRSGPCPQLNLWVRTAPRGADEFCWHIDIVPRLTIAAGFELGTGVAINVYAPERAAADLREALG